MDQIKNEKLDANENKNNAPIENKQNMNAAENPSAEKAPEVHADNGAGQYAEAFEFHNRLMKSSMFTGFLNNMGALLDPANNPVMKTVEEQAQYDPEFDEDCVNMNVTDAELASKTPAFLLYKAKQIVEELQEPFPEDYHGLNENEMVRLKGVTKLPLVMTKLAEAFRKQNGIMQNQVGGDKKYDLDFTEPDFDEFRMLEIGSSIFAEVSKVNQHAMEEVTLAQNTEKEKVRFEETKVPFRKDQRRLRYELERFTEANRDKVYNFGKCYSDGREEKQETVLDMTHFAEHPEYYTEEDNYFDKVSQGFDEALAIENKVYMKTRQEYYSDAKKAVDSINREHNNEAKSIRSQYTAEQEEYDRLSSTTLKRQKKFDEYAEYKSYQAAVDEMLKQEENFTQIDSAYYRNLNFREDVESLVNSEDSQAELDKVNRQIAEAQARFDTSKDASEEARKNLESAQEIARKKEELPEILQQEDEKIAENLLGIHMATWKDKDARDITKYKDEWLTNELKSLKKEAVRVFMEELNRPMQELDASLNEKSGLKGTVYNQIADDLDNFRIIARRDEDFNISFSIHTETIDNLRRDCREGNRTASIARQITVIDQQIELYKISLDEGYDLRSKDIQANLELDEKTRKAKLDALNAQYKKINAAITRVRQGPMKGVMENARQVTEARQKYENTVDTFVAKVRELVPEKEQDRTNIQEKKAAEIADQKTNQQQESIQPEVLEELKATSDEATELHQADAVNLAYLKALKGVLEKGQEWQTKKTQLSHVSEQDRLLELKDQLRKRDARLADNEEKRQRSLDTKKNKLIELLNEAKQLHENEITSLNQRKGVVQQAKQDTTRIRRAFKAVKKSADKVREGKIAADNRINEEYACLKNEYDNQRSLYSAREEELFKNITSSKKTLGSDSAYFNDLKQKITAYQTWKQEYAKKPNADGLKAAEYETKTAELNSAIDVYLEHRDNGKSKWTKKGQLRLDYIRSLKTCLKNNLDDMKSFEKRSSELNSSYVEIRMQAATKLELNMLKSDKLLKASFFPGKLAEQLGKEPEPNQQPITDAEKTGFDEANWGDEVTEIANGVIDGAEKLMDAQDRLPAEMEKARKEQEKIREQNDYVYKETEIPKLNFNTLAQLDPDWEKTRNSYPYDLRVRVDEYYRLLCNVPKDYGYEEYVAGQKIFKMSRKRYEQKNLGIEKFRKDNHLRNPKVTDEERDALIQYTKATVDIDKGFGYSAYLLQYANEHPEQKPGEKPMTKNEFLQKKFKLADATEPTIIQCQIEQTRKAAKELGLEDPRTKIPQYGEIFDSKGYNIEQAHKKLAEAKAEEKWRNQIISEINQYDAKVEEARLKQSEYGLKQYLKTADIMTTEAYGKSMLGLLAYQLEKKLVDPRNKYAAANGQYTEAQKEEIRQFDQELESNRTYGYEKYLEKRLAEEKKKYIESGAGVEKYLADKKINDPRMKYHKEITGDLVLKQLYRPDLVEEMTTELLMMSQLSENAPAEDYEKDALTVLENNLHYREDEKDAPYNPLSNKLLFDDEYYYAGFEDYPEDLQKQIKEYDRIMAAVPDDWGYGSFEKNIDYFGKFTREQYGNLGIGKKYFAQTYQLVDPRIPMEQAVQIKRFDMEMADVKSGKAYREYKQYQAKNIDDAKKSKISFRDFVDTIYTQEQFRKDNEKVKNDYMVINGLNDPREEIPNYGRIVLQKKDYQPEPLFDDSERLNRNKRIVEETKSYIEAVSDVKPEYGYEKYIKETVKSEKDIAQFVTLKEYCMREMGRRQYLLDNNLTNPIVKYGSFIHKDKELRDELTNVTAEFNKFTRENLEAMKKKEDYQTSKEKENALKRDNALKKIAEEEKADQKIVEDTYKNFDSFARGYLRSRGTYLAWIKDPEGLTKENIAKLEKAEKLFQEQLKAAVENLDPTNQNTIRFQRKCRQYCDNLTVDDIEQEKKFIENFMKETCEVQVLPWKKPQVATPEDVYFFSMRMERVQQLEKQRDAKLQREETMKKLGKKPKLT